MIRDKVFIINLDDEKVGEIVKDETGYHVTHKNESYSSTSLPRILQDIAPAPTQKEALPDILNYYKMDRYDVWEYLKRSNGFKTSRDIYFVSAPPGEIWVPLRIPRDLTMLMNVGDTFTIMGNGIILVNRHRIIKLPQYLTSLIDTDKAAQNGMTDIKGYVQDVRATGVFMGVNARLVLNFPAECLTVLPENSTG